MRGEGRINPEEKKKTGMIRSILKGDLDLSFLKVFTAANWILMVLMVAAAGAFSTPRMAAGVLLGALIANLNCAGLDKDCKRMMRWRHMGAYYGGMAVRMGLIALTVTVAFLYFPGIFSPVGLFIGLSVAVVNFNIVTLAMVIYRVRFKEAT